MSVASLPKTVVNLGVFMLIPLTVYCTRYHGNASSRYFFSSTEQDGSMNRLKYSRSSPRSGLTMDLCESLKDSVEESDAGTGGMEIG